MNDEWRWLESTRRLQEDAFGRRFPIDDPDEFADYITMNHSAAVIELSEFMQETGWKDWAVPRGWVNRDAAVGEIVDAAHFIANILTALNVTDDEWEQRYRAKQALNRTRQDDGYDGVTGKCPGCRRAYDDVGVGCVPGGEVPADDALVVRVVSAWCDRLDRYV